MTGITRSTAAKLMAGYFGTSAVHVGGTYDTYTVEDTIRRKWKVVSDSSIQCQSRGERTASRQYSVEVVSPICRYEDLETIQQVVRTLRRGGAKVNESCGIHIHVDASAHDSKTLRNIVNIMASKEDLLYKALKVRLDRQYYCQKADLRFLEDINGKRPKSMQELETLPYHNAVFLGCDTEGQSRHAHLRSTAARGTYKGNAPGSRPEYSFHWIGGGDTLFLFESPIDLLSYLSMHKAGWKKNSYAAACGVSDKVLWQCLKDYSQLKKVLICLDNDNPGKIAAEKISQKLEQKNIDHAILVPRHKDWNEDLLHL